MEPAPGDLAAAPPAASPTATRAAVTAIPPLRATGASPGATPLSGLAARLAARVAAAAVVASFAAAVVPGAAPALAADARTAAAKASPAADAGPGRVVVLDSGDRPSAWTALAAPGASASVSAGTGDDRGSVLLDFDLGRGRAHVIARRKVAAKLPADYMFVFSVRAEAEPNTVEIKFISGENVWWRRLPDVELPRTRSDLRVSRSRIAFAWGPAGGGMPRDIDAIEIAIVAGKGGRGRLWIDEVRLEPRDPAAASRAPVASATSNQPDAAFVLDDDAATVWRSAPDDRAPAVVLDFHQDIEQGGLEIEHAGDGFSKAYVVEASRDGATWKEARRFTQGDGGIDHVYLPDLYARWLRVRFDVPPDGHAALRAIRPRPFEYSASPNGFFSHVAAAAGPGLYPRYFFGEQSYWTVVGVAGDDHEALVNEEGMVEVDAGAFSLDPFVRVGDRLRTWKGATGAVSLMDGDLPIPTVARRDDGYTLDVTAFASGRPGASTLYVRYRVRAIDAGLDGALYVAIRPLQVLPPWQALNRTGGATTIRRIRRSGADVAVDSRRVVAWTEPDAFGAAMFEEGDVSSYLARGVLPHDVDIDDPFAHASAAFAWHLDLDAGETRDVWVAVPMQPDAPVAPRARRGLFGAADDATSPPALLAAAHDSWRSVVDGVAIELPPAARDHQQSLHAGLAHVLINRDGAAIQPGSRTYERSWIRDGAMTSGALLELGRADEVKEFLRWYALHIGRDGWVPCCVDARGADPVPEHDSFGEFLWAVAEVWRFTRDDAFVREMWPTARAVAGCILRLRSTRMTPEYRRGAKKAMFGLLPESISHEGYSARPVHSYWDQAFALRGLADAALLARVACDHEAAKRLEADRADFARTLGDSIRATMRAHRMSFVPASVELGDFDPTSTSVAFLLGAEDLYPRDALDLSFARYVDDLRGRRGLETPGVGYTAYEMRSATALVLLGMKERALELLDTLVADQRPPAWRQWPEISWLRRTEPSFLGDLPHSWIGSSYLHAIRTLLVTERENVARIDGPPRDPGLLVGAGIPLRWLRAGGDVRGRALPTWFGPLSVRVRVEDPSGQRPLRAVVDLDTGAASPSAAPSSPATPREAEDAGGACPAPFSGARDFTMPADGIEVAAPFGAEVDSAAVDGVPVPVEGDVVRVTRLPATVVFAYKPPLENQR